MSGSGSVTQKPSRNPKYLRLHQEMRRRILSGEYAIGTKLPSVQQLSQEFGICTATAFKGLQELARERLVATHVGPKGTVVCRPPSSLNQKLLACLLRPFRPRNQYDNFAVDVMEGIQKEISARGYRFIYHSVTEDDYENRMIELAESGLVTGMVLDQLLSDEAVERLGRLGVPSVLFNRIHIAENVSAVSPDYESAARESVRILRERNYRRLAYYWPMEAAWVPGEVVVLGKTFERGFRAGLEKEGVPQRDVVWMKEVYPKDPAINSPEQFGFPVRKGPDWTPLGIFASTDVRARQLIDVLAKTDLVIGRDVGIIGMSDLECNRGGPRPFNTWSVDRQNIGREVVQELISRIENPGIGRSVVKITMTYVDRGSA